MCDQAIEFLLQHRDVDALAGDAHCRGDVGLGPAGPMTFDDQPTGMHRGAGVSV
jgi:hypothetical protein